MFKYLKRYPVSIAFILIVIYLSFFRPPSVGVPKIPHLDKVVHLGMYFVLSGLLWFEFLHSHKKGDSLRRAWVGAFVFPVIFSGMIEIMQEYLTSYRGGEWLDFLANTTGAALASILAYFFFRSKMLKD